MTEKKGEGENVGKKYVSKGPRRGRATLLRESRIGKELFRETLGGGNLSSMGGTGFKL